MADEENREAIDKLWKSFVKKRKLDEEPDAQKDDDDETEPFSEEKEM